MEHIWLISAQSLSIFFIIIIDNKNEYNGWSVKADGNCTDICQTFW
jgi:hypothetical protein